VTLADLGQAKRIEVGKKTPSSSTVPALLLTSRPRETSAFRSKKPRATDEKLQERVEIGWRCCGDQGWRCHQVEMKRKSPRGRRTARHALL
jgi:hypothetical protein